MDRLKFEGIPVDDAVGFLDVIPLKDAMRENYYFLSNDKVDFSALKFSKENASVLGVGTVDFFHVLEAIGARNGTIRRIVAFDMNAAQLMHFKGVRDDLIKSRSRIEFLERFFCVKLSHDLVRALQDYRSSRSRALPGEIRGAGGVEEERVFWRNVIFDEHGFAEKYGVQAQNTEVGLLIQAKILTGHENYLATAKCLEKNLNGKPVFSLRFGHGFLRDEESFQRLRKLLADTATYIVRLDVGKDLPSLLRYLRYEPVILWTSNIFNRPFVANYPVLGTVASEINKLGNKTNGFPQMDITCLYDMRDRSSLKVRPRSRLRSCLMNPHYKTFRKIVSLLEDGDSLEVVNAPQWISQDKGISKLPRTDYCLAEDFMGRTDVGKRRNIFLHSLLSHGVTHNEFNRIFRRALHLGSKVLVLEHNPRSLELRKMRLPDIPQYIDDLKTPYVRHSVSGKWLPRRNYIYEFSGKAID